MEDKLKKVLERRTKAIKFVEAIEKIPEEHKTKNQMHSSGYAVGKLYGIEHTLDQFYPNWEDDLVDDKRFTR